VCDLNGKSLPLFPPHDVAVFSGVLEYVNDLPRLVAFLAKTVDTVVASYVDTGSVAQRATRRRHGWVNDYSAGQLEKVFGDHGFHLDRVETWRNQRIYVMSKREAKP
jgi:hypothetical protein